MQHNLFLLTLAIWAIFANMVFAGNEDSENSLSAEAETEIDRNGKFVSPFTIVRFPNNKCEGTNPTEDGTCYTTEECTAKGGTGRGVCANGFGVCCIFALKCGGSSSENYTYIKQTGIQTLTPSLCTYRICKCSSDICRIRFDFQEHVIAKPIEGTQVTGGAGTAANRGNIGKCNSDLFYITGLPGTPTICGYNSGQHMIVDASDICHIAAFYISPTDTTTMRMWDMTVTQYSCSEISNGKGGPLGCLQYFTAITGTISSFNFPASGTAITNSVTHLSNQMYNICIRRAKDYCYICYVPSSADAGGNDNQASFGLGVSGDAMSKSLINEGCTTDFIGIPGGTSITIAMQNDVIGADPASTAVTKICGRFFNTAANLMVSASICTRNAPFSLHVTTDSSEVTALAIDDASKSEESRFPAGIIGFSLNYVQGTCTP